MEACDILLRDSDVLKYVYWILFVAAWFETGTIECLGSIQGRSFSLSLTSSKLTRKRNSKRSTLRVLSSVDKVQVYAHSYLSNIIISVNKDDICCCFIPQARNKRPAFFVITYYLHSDAYGNVCCIIYIVTLMEMCVMNAS